VTSTNKSNSSDTSGERTISKYDGYWQNENDYLIAKGTLGYICADDLKSSSRFVLENDRMMNGDYFSNVSLSLSTDKKTLTRIGEDKGVKYTFA
jgi:Zn/Cd-binding protein ZinT